jgi:MtN3 and saliva related transmembrane protein
MDIVILGLLAGAITSVGFIPQLVKGYRTKKLDDVSYWMPLVLVFGMFLWLVYGILRSDIAIIVANIFAVGCNSLLIIMKRYYENHERSPNGHNI